MMCFHEQEFGNFAQSLCMNEQDSWDDLRFLLAVARNGSLSAAARALGVNHSTVLRRVAALEESMGVRLFDKRPGGYVLTSAGDEMHRVALKVEEELATASRRLSGSDSQISGTLRFTTLDILALHILPRHIAAFRALHPTLSVDMIVAEASLSLTRREADVAIRSTNRPPENLVGRAVAWLAFAVYGSASYLDSAPPADGVAGHVWVGLDETFDHTSMMRWLRKSVPPDRIACRVNSVATVLELVKAGAGLGLLPCGLADRCPGLRRVGPLVEEVGSKIWLLTHEDLRHMGRVRAFMDFMGDAFAQDRALLEGRQAP